MRARTSKPPDCSPARSAAVLVLVLVLAPLLACARPSVDTDADTSAGPSDGSTADPSTGGSTVAAETTSTTAATTSADSSDASTVADSSTGAPACVLEESGPVTVTADGQIIERLHVVSTDGPAIVVEGFANVVIRDVWIEHAGGPGIVLSGADDALVERVAIEHTGAPRTGENPSDELVNLFCYDSARMIANDVRMVRGSSGAYVLECPEPTLAGIEGHDFRGPFPRGQLAQFDKSDGAVLEDFSVVNPPGSWPEDNVNVYQSIDATIRRGLIDGNNSPSGVGVIFDGDLALGLVEDVDAIRMGNGCFSDYAGSDGVVFRRTRCRENICEDQGRGVPLSNALMWSGNPDFTMIRIEDSQYFAACNPGNIVWPEESFAVIEVDEQDFALREPIAVALCWE